MAECNEDNVNNMLEFLFEAPYNEEMVRMDCNDYCEQLADLAEKVASGNKLEDILPDWEAHIRYWQDCREEFEALVVVLKAEYDGHLPDGFEEFLSEDE